MKLARFDAGDGPRVGIVSGGRLVDVSAEGGPAWTMMEIIAGAPETLSQLRKVRDVSAVNHLIDDVRLLAPIERPGKYLAIGLNYQAHVDESLLLGASPTPHQMWINKQTTCLSGPFDAIDPGVTKALDYEVELGVVIGRAAKGVPAAEARGHVFGYFVANDVTARDWQMHSPTFTVGKSFDTHGPVGPWIVTADEVPDPHALDLRCHVNGELRQSSNTRHLIHNIDQQIAYLSEAFTLEPGDLLATGTPDGIGAAMTPPKFLKPGDVVRCEIEGLGAIENTVAGKTE